MAKKIHWHQTSDNKDPKIRGSSPPNSWNSTPPSFTTTTVTMNTSRLATSLLLRASRSSIPRSARQFRTLPRPAIQLQSLITKPSQSRFYSQEKPSKIYTFEDVLYPLHPHTPSCQPIINKPPQVQALTKSPSPKTILIDTREPSELQSTGTIPGSLNIPVTSKPDAFFISPEEFEDRFGFERPGKDREVVFYCKAGVRSRAAAGLAKQAGWENVGEYKGSWLDWEKNGGETERVRWLQRGVGELGWVAVVN